MTEHFDALETRSPAEREAAQMAALSQQVAHARSNTSAFAELLNDVDPAGVNSREALARLPVTRKSELLQRQKAARAAGGDAFGGFSKAPPGTTGAPAGPCMPLVSGPATWSTTVSATT